MHTKNPLMPQNPAKHLASRFINSTGRHVFLTGKAGTGKTTFLKNIVAQTHKKAVIAAPTGIAAINAGGVTLHSLFQLPFGTFLPSEKGLSQQEIRTETHTPSSLIRGRRYFEAKRKLLQEIELLIIDEVSMLRADLLDAIDIVLRHVRRRRESPFGGVQILFIGDLLQLPPVVKQDEWQLLQDHYPSMYFFHARALKKDPPLYIELENIYRQSDPSFIRLLNKIRDNGLDEAGRKELNQHVKPNFDPLSTQGYVYLTTHNHKANRINKKAIGEIKGPEFTFQAAVEGEFDERLYPIDALLTLKEGAQVMFVKNDHTGAQRYFNGKIGIVECLDDEEITVGFPDGSPSTQVERHTWENKKYTLNRENNEIEEKLQGTFAQYPLKLAWAITVHKSQGLTFDKAVIDVSSAFAPGQIYVAMSRLTSLEGMVLSQPLPAKPPGQDTALQQFSTERQRPESLQETLKMESRIYLRQELMRIFHFGSLASQLHWHLQSYNKEEKRSAKQNHRSWAADLCQDFDDEKTTADRFRNELAKRLHASNQQDIHAIRTRVQKAGEYFKPRLQKFSKRVIDHIANMGEQKGVKTYIRELRDLETAFYERMQLLHKASVLVTAMIEDKEPTRHLTNDPGLKTERQSMLAEGAMDILERQKKDKKNRKPKAAKGYSAELSLAMYKEGKSVEEIARIRELAQSTIMSHMTENVRKGLLPVSDFLDAQKLGQVLAAAKAVKSHNATDIMRVLGGEFTYQDIRIALAHQQQLNTSE